MIMALNQFLLLIHLLTHILSVYYGAKNTVILTAASQKVIAILMTVSLPNTQLTNLHNSITTTLRSEFIIKPPLKIPPQLKRVATLPCEIPGTFFLLRVDSGPFLHHPVVQCPF